MVPSSIAVREVWQSNLEYEFKLINSCLGQFRIASFDSEFPGTIFSNSHIPKYILSSLSPVQLYPMMKQNVDALKIIQIGLTLSDTRGNLPYLGTRFGYVWQFKFRDFDPHHDPHNPESISLLRSQGIDFVNNMRMCIESRTFASMFIECGLGRGSGLTWVTFHDLYDYGFLIKILTARQLPYRYEEFKKLLHSYLGLEAEYDLKPMSNRFGLYGGLEKIAKSLNLNRAIGKSHQAGSDSLLIMQLFLEIINKFFTPVPLVN